MSRRLIIILVIGLIALAWGWFYGPAAHQRQGIAAASALEEQLAPKLVADPRFAAISLSVSTHPALIVHGEVPDGRAMQDLKAIVTLPPGANYKLLFVVQIATPATSQQESVSP